MFIGVFILNDSAFLGRTIIYFTLYKFSEHGGIPRLCIVLNLNPTYLFPYLQSSFLWCSALLFAFNIQIFNLMDTNHSIIMKHK